MAALWATAGGVDFGISGVPETFVVDGRGMIVAKHIGPMTDQDAGGLECQSGRPARRPRRAQFPTAVINPCFTIPLGAVSWLVNHSYSRRAALGMVQPVRPSQTPGVDSAFQAPARARSPEALARPSAPSSAAALGKAGVWRRRAFTPDRGGRAHAGPGRRRPRPPPPPAAPPSPRSFALSPRSIPMGPAPRNLRPGSLIDIRV